MTNDSNDDGPRYGIGAVARLTGLTDHTIRVWERRYQAVVAERAANGRRQYSPQDVEKLGLLKRLTDAGISIGQIAGDSIAALADRAQSLSELANSPAPDRIAVAVLGETIVTQLRGNRDLAPLDVVVADSNHERFVADLAGHTPDIVVLESPVLDPDTLSRLADLQESCGARAGMIVFGFAASRDVERARSAGVATLRAPTDPEQLRVSIVQAISGVPRPVSAPTPAAREPAAVREPEGPIPPRRFTREQLATLANASTSIDCECPHHLAQLVTSLTAFEVYSANCASRDADDAALHHYLHRTTAEARTLIEAALDRVARAEGISY